MILADFYGRKSTKDDGRSVASQEDEWRADCEQQDLDPGRVFADPDRSASRYATRSRPDYETLLDHIRSGSCKLLSMWESSRGSRNLADWVALLDLCRTQGVLIRIVSHERTYDVRKRRDWRTLADDGVNSADESEIISERARRGIRAAARAGRPTYPAPYGYRRIYDDRGHYVAQVEHPDQAPIIRELITKAAAGVSLMAIAADLNARGIPSATGRQWHGHVVRSMAVNPAYAGFRVHQGVVVGAADWEPLVDPQLWRKAQALLTAPQRRTGRDTRLKHWLAAVIRCGVCETGRLRPAVRSDQRPIYKCAACSRVSAHAGLLEESVEETLLARLTTTDLADLFTADVDDAGLAAARDVEDQLTRRLDAHYAEAAAGRLSAAGLSVVEGRLLPELRQAEMKVRRLSVPPALADLAGVDIPASWGGFTAARRRAVVTAAADLVIGPGSRGRLPQPDMLTRLGGSRWTGDSVTWAQRGPSGRS